MLSEAQRWQTGQLDLKTKKKLCVLNIAFRSLGRATGIYGLVVPATGRHITERAKKDIHRIVTAQLGPKRQEMIKVNGWM